jgi:hypothetical protein
VVPGVDGVTAVACGAGELGVVGPDRPVRVIAAATGAVRWESPSPIDGAGIGHGWLSGAPRWVVTVAGLDGEVPYLLFDEAGGVATGVDVAPDRSAGPVAIVQIFRPFF